VSAAWLPRRADGGPLRIGHRGAAALAPANTLAAIETALASGLDGIELDAVAAGPRLLAAHSAAEVSEDTPALDEALGAAAAGVGLLVCDLKSPGAEAAVVEALRRHGLVGRTVLASFFPDALRRAKELEPALRTSRSFPNDRAGVSGRLPAPAIRAGLGLLRPVLPLRIGPLLRAAEADAATLHHLVVSTALVRRCRALGAPVLAWTVNDRAALARVEELGVDAVITDDPGIFA
jgi:glycerophosphoryl diester phosphodiesterase